MQKSKVKDLSGLSFGRLSVVERDVGRHNRYAYWVCECCCGAMVSIRGTNLSSGHTKSCGCLHKDIVTQNSLKHGKYNTKEYRTWCNMKSRCYDPRQSNYHLYGGRGVTVCQEWINSFTKFLSDLGEAPSTRHTLDRIDNNGHYVANNCRWVTYHTQSRNKRSNIMVSGQCLKDYCHQHGIVYRTILTRLHRGWSLDRALSTPTGARSI